VNQTNKQTRISFKELPARARKLDGKELSAVFGGCGIKGSVCNASRGALAKECCPRFACAGQNSWDFQVCALIA
jgi:hypothetical protein